MDHRSSGSSDGSSTGTTRRTAVRRAAGALAGALALAGCTEDVGDELPENEHWPTADVVPDLPVARRTDVLERGIEELSRVDVEDVDGLVAALEERDLTVEAADEVAEQLHLEYVETAPARRGTYEVLGPVAGGYAALLDAGAAFRALQLLLRGPEGDAVGVAEVSTGWASAFAEGSLSAGEYAELVAGTVESEREPPDPHVGPDV